MRTCGNTPSGDDDNNGITHVSNSPKVSAYGVWNSNDNDVTDVQFV